MGVFAHFGLLMHQHGHKGLLVFLFAQRLEQAFLIFGHGTADAMITGPALAAELADADAGRGDIGHVLT